MLIAEVVSPALKTYINMWFEENKLSHLNVEINIDAYEQTVTVCVLENGFGLVSGKMQHCRKYYAKDLSVSRWNEIAQSFADDFYPDNSTSDVT